MKIGVDIGGTNLRVALVENNRIIKLIKKKTPKTKTLILKDLFYLISSIMNKNVKGIGISCAGAIENGVIKRTPNLPLNGVNLKKAVKNKFKIKTFVENDANCAILAEAKLGVCKKNFLILTLGTGIGGGIIVNGNVYYGRGCAGELGHIILDNGKDFESLAGGKNLKKLTKRYFKKELLVRDLVKMNNSKANKVLKEISNYVGQGIGSLINVLDPEVVVLTGGMREGGNKFLNMIKKEVNKYSFISKTEIKWSKFENPGIIGASLLM